MSSKEPPSSATVVVCTFRRPESLQRTLGGLAGQADPGVSWDVVVVDNDEPPGAEGVVEAFRSTSPVAVTFVREPARGSAHARNRGIAEATGDVTVITDDDVVPAPGWLAALLDPILAGRADATGGRVVLDPSVPRPRWFRDDDVGAYLTHHVPSEVERPLARGEYLVTANCAFRREILARTGGFSTALGPRGSTQLVNDDVLIGRRFEESGGVIVHAPDALVVHELPRDRLSLRYVLRRAYLQGRSDWILDAEELRLRRWGGAFVPAYWWRDALVRRRRQGLASAEALVGLLCDVARGLGLLRELLGTPPWRSRT